MFDLRAFLINKINDGFSRHIRSDPLAFSQDYKITDKLTYCISNNLIPFLLEGKNDTLIITQDIMSELNTRHRIENLTSLKDVRKHLGFEYVNRYINKRKSRILEGVKDNFIKFIDVNIE